MRIADFELYKDILRERTGLMLEADQTFIVESRLTPVARKWGYPSVSAMTMTLRGVPDEEIIDDIIEAMMMAETAFFRDQKPFDAFEKTVMPYLLDTRRRQRTLRIWCAAAASGQEPYSLAILLKEMESKLSGWRVDILATDLSANALEKADRGVYSQFEVQQGIPVQTLVKHFDQLPDNKWRVKHDLRRYITFGQFNLLGDMSRLGHFDLILCRNVLNLLEPDVGTGILERLSQCLEEDGFLILGKGEKPTESYKEIDSSGCLFALSGSKHKMPDAAVA